MPDWVRPPRRKPPLKPGPPIRYSGGAKPPGKGCAVLALAMVSVPLMLAAYFGYHALS